MPKLPRAALWVAAVAWLAPAGCGAEDGVTVGIGPDALLEQIEAGEAPVLLDVRTAAEFDAGHVPGALNISHDELPARISELQSLRGREVVVYCERGGRAAKAEAVLRDAGFESVRHLEGDMSGWRSRDLPCEGCGSE